jgi:hypothetical protein
VDEHILAARLLNESIALGWIEPLHRAARHRRSLTDYPRDIILSAAEPAAMRQQSCIWISLE